MPPAFLSAALFPFPQQPPGQAQPRGSRNTDSRREARRTEGQADLMRPLRHTEGHKRPLGCQYLRLLSVDRSPPAAVGRYGRKQYTILLRSHCA